MNQDIVLKVDHLKKYFPIKQGVLGKDTQYVHAVDDVSFEMERGMVIGLVGESGCGKSTLAQTVMGLYKPTEGRIEVAGVDLSSKTRNSKEMKRHIQIVFQDPFWSLNPRMPVKDIIGEPLKVHKMVKNQDQMIERVGELLELVGLSKERMYAYPHEFSGGERQRVAIARSLALNPEILLLDEPTSSIDTISQVEILNLLVSLKEKFNLSYILISHDLSVIHYLSDQIVVMYLGEVVEIGKTEEVFNHRLHPYTKALMRAIPIIENGKVEKVEALEGNVPSAVNPPSGCRFHDRCEFCKEKCISEKPELREVKQNHKVACHFAGSI